MGWQGVEEVFRGMNDVERPKLYTEHRKKQATPEELLATCMQDVRDMFYGRTGNPEQDKARDKMWYREQHDVRKMAVLQLAEWLDEKAVTLPTERYSAFLRERWIEIKRHSQQETYKYLPGFIGKCLERHLTSHGDELYEEGKAFRGSLEKVLAKVGQARPIDPIKALATVQAALNKARGVRRNQTAEPGQGELF